MPFTNYNKHCKKNLFQIEQKINFLFKEIIIILNNSNSSFVSLSGFKN